MANFIEQIFSGILVVAALVIGIVAFTSGTTSQIKTVQVEIEIKELQKAYEQSVKNFESRINLLEGTVSNMSELSQPERELLYKETGIADLKKQNEKVMSLMKIVQDSPEKVFEFKDLKLKQESDKIVTLEKINSLEKVTNIQVASLTDKLETAKFYNNILVSIVILMLGVVWKQTVSLRREHNELVKARSE
ncbi:TPA: hypothetical protein ACN33E_003942 [Vibrio parahaemolyticus]|uniref:hypothetical protein n=1 Tax=Vibrio harveyi group TaxID=717610 RepID=UPI00193DD0C5|nr:hypothetical protein [Vibrio parahaemolyticus]ELR9975131.1 hypothetical protein [Vibrio parahaemolyticus]MBM4968962.1 hypothetical protein [Vibrio parahaemolyticus]MCX8773986.1 hypothetical protein [Vibrio parahaemolyticus]HCG8153910.1 hypothetical protein [Vibrio parahaemolyticus]